jgi:triphosphoribosyl-dephospho-CoA synthase
VDPASFLAARDGRAALAAGLLRRARARGSRAIVWITVNVPGPDKRPPGIDLVFGAAAAAAAARLPGVEVALQGADLLGPYLALFSSGVPADVKRAAIALEEAAPARRLVDIDVYDDAGLPVDRQLLGLPPRACLVCHEPARECIRLGRHDAGALAHAVAALLRPLGPEALARGLVTGARVELDLTPKPGLVDRHDNGSHPDLSYALMRRSIDLLPAYFGELLTLRGEGADLGTCIEAGRRAERRMFDALGANAHRGYIFLGGLLLLAACDAERAGGSATRGRAPQSADADGHAGRQSFASVRDHVRALAREFFDRGPVPDATASSHGARARLRHGVDGIRAESLGGLPSVFDEGLPAFEDALARTGNLTAASYALLGVLMLRVEDTTAVHRCGPDGLARLRRDGRTLVELVVSGADPVPQVEAWNDEYRRLGLTMGGVADCMAAVFALHQLGAPTSSVEAL